MLKVMRLQKRGTAGEHTDVIDNTYDISNAERLGKSEVLQCRFISEVLEYNGLLLTVSRITESAILLESKWVDGIIPCSRYVQIHCLIESHQLVSRIIYTRNIESTKYQVSCKTPNFFLTTDQCF